MLTRNLLRFAVRGDRLEPRWLKPTPAVLALAEELLTHWRGGLGRMRGELEEAESAILHGARQLLLGRGLSKVLTDACDFGDPASAEALRERALVASFARLAKPADSAETHRTAVAGELGLAPEALADGLYADLPDRAVLAQVPGWDAGDLIARCNIALAQGLLLGASELRVHLRDRERGIQRRLLRALARRRLVVEVASADGGGLYLTISGPAAVLDQRSAYGMQLALWLPALACAKAWTATAAVVPPRATVAATLELDAALGLPGDLALLDWVPPELAAWMAQIPAKLPGWKLAEAEPIVLQGGAVVLPDLALDDGTGVVAVELFHRWHLSQLRTRLDQLRSGALPNLLIGVDRALQRLAEARPLLDDPLIAQRGFLFSDLPAPRALNEALKRLRNTATPA
jgi:predicted nuclease of restriction endonuclease-like RecB superfamily